MDRFRFRRFGRWPFTSFRFRTRCWRTSRTWSRACRRSSKPPTNLPGELKTDDDKSFDINTCIIVKNPKNPFGVVPINVFQFGVIYKSCRQVLTQIHNSQPLFKLPILDKFRLATFHTSAPQRNYSIKTGINQLRRNESPHDLESSRTVWRWVLLKCVLFLQQH